MQNDVFERIRRDITGNDVVLYMKGTAVFPQDGFSAAMVQILENLGIPFRDIDVLLDRGLHSAVKDFPGDWPRVPQLYIKGEFIGGCDSVRELYAAGDLKRILAENGLLP